MLTWNESNNIEFRRLEELIADIRTRLVSMVTDKQKKSSPAAIVQSDMIDPGIIENAVYNSRIETDNQILKNKQDEEGRKIGFENRE